MGRWLAPRLPGPQRWVLHDRDPALLALAAGRLPAAAADSSPVVAETRTGDVTALTAADLAGAGLVTASALLDLLTAAEVDALATACAGARCPALFTLSVVGRVELVPGDPLRRARRRGLRRSPAPGGRRPPPAGPGTPSAPAAAAFDARGAEVDLRPSLWRLAAADRALTEAWLLGLDRRGGRGAARPAGGARTSSAGWRRRVRGRSPSRCTTPTCSPAGQLERAHGHVPHQLDGDPGGVVLVEAVLHDQVGQVAGVDPPGQVMPGRDRQNARVSSTKPDVL